MLLHKAIQEMAESRKHPGHIKMCISVHILLRGPAARSVGKGTWWVSHACGLAHVAVRQAIFVFVGWSSDTGLLQDGALQLVKCLCWGDPLASLPEDE